MVKYVLPKHVTRVRFPHLALLYYNVSMRQCKHGFTLIEVLLVVSIMAMLAALLLGALAAARDKAYYGRALQEFNSMNEALQLYLAANNNVFPPDASRDQPAAFSTYLAGYTTTTWPKGPWPGSFYDWDNWDDPDHVGQKIYQISIRFCPASGTLADCRFPKASWASNFGLDSAVYYCISGYCRPHESEPVTYPGLCVNC